MNEDDVVEMSLMSFLISMMSRDVIDARLALSHLRRSSTSIQLREYLVQSQKITWSRDEQSLPIYVLNVIGDVTEPNPLAQTLSW